MEATLLPDHRDSSGMSRWPDSGFGVVTGSSTLTGPGRGSPAASEAVCLHALVVHPDHVRPVEVAAGVVAPVAVVACVAAQVEVQAWARVWAYQEPSLAWVAEPSEVEAAPQPVQDGVPVEARVSLQALVPAAPVSAPPAEARAWAPASVQDVLPVWVAAVYALVRVGPQVEVQAWAASACRCPAELAWVQVLLRAAAARGHGVCPGLARA